MKPHEALEEVRKDLTVSFGEGLAARLLLMARATAGAPIVGLDKTKYVELLKTLCGDERVVGMLGEFGAREKQTHWEKLV